MATSAPSIATPWTGQSSGAAVEWLRSTIGPLLLILVTPPAAIVFWIVCTFEPFNGALTPLLTAQGWQALVHHWPWPSLPAAEIIAAFALVQVVLLRWLPGPRFLGPITPANEQPVYRLNGVAAWAITHLLFLVGSLTVFRAGVVWDRFGEILATLVLFALLFCVFLYLKGRWWPSSADRSLSGNFIWDYYWGVELHPTLFGINLKQLINCRLSMMAWSLIVCAFAAKQLELFGELSSGMLVSVALTVLYLFKFFWWESGYFTSLDVMHDRFGYYIGWGVLAWVPAVYTLTAQYLVLRPNNLSWPVALGLFLFGAAAIYVNYAADEQRQRVRACQGDTTVWGRKPELIRASYTTGDGERHQSLLLASGWWGLARHFHYVPEIALALAWSLPAGFDHFVPYFYVAFLTILLIDRANRDDKRCEAKYGADWHLYRQRVRWKILPGVY